jgi:DNA-binding transcriptional LysR family regulator
MELRELRSLLAFAESGSLVKAARRFHVSGPAVHKQIKTLEAELGVRLYEREGRNLSLTQAGELLLPYARSLIAQHDAAMSAVEEWRGVKRGLLRIGTGPNISSYILPGMLKRFRRFYEKVDIAVHTGSSSVLSQELLNGGIDLALLVTSSAPEDSVFRIETSWDVEYVLVSNIRGAPRECPIGELTRYPFIHFRKGSRIETLLDHYFAEVRFQPNVIMTFDNSEAIKAVIRQGTSIAMLPYWIVDAELRRGELRMIRQKEHRVFSRMDLVSRRTGYVPPPIAAFVKLASEFRSANPRLTSLDRRRLEGPNRARQ